MPKRLVFSVVVRRISTGEEHARQIFAHNEATARYRAMARAQNGRGVPITERKCGQFVVLSCTQLKENI